jgi:Fe-S-cluster-containing hydrogenase component 2
MACPFGVIQVSRQSPFIVKCDRCPDRAIPACVEACHTHALQLEDDYLRMRHQEAVYRLTEAVTAGRRR